MTAEDGNGEPPAGPEPAPESAPETTPETIMESVAEAGRRAGRSYREIAVDLFGADLVDAEWHRDGWMRARVRRLLRRIPGSLPRPSTCPGLRAGSRGDKARLAAKHGPRGG